MAEGRPKIHRRTMEPQSGCFAPPAMVQKENSPTSDFRFKVRFDGDEGECIVTLIDVLRPKKLID